MIGWMLCVFCLGFAAGHTVCYLKAQSVISSAKQILREQIQREEALRKQILNELEVDSA